MQSLLNSIFDQFSSTVGNGRDNDPDDVRKLKEQLGLLGYLKEPEEGHHECWDRDIDGHPH